MRATHFFLNTDFRKTLSSSSSNRRTSETGERFTTSTAVFAAFVGGRIHLFAPLMALLFLVGIGASVPAQELLPMPEL